MAINYIYNMKKLLLLSSAFMLMAFSGWAQKTVAGIVLDEGGLPLPGATVIEKGTSNGVFPNSLMSHSIYVFPIQ